MAVGRTPILLAVIGGLGFMGWLWLSGGDCPGGREYRTVDACNAAGERPGDCRDWFADANRQLGRRGPFYLVQDECIAQHVTCQRAEIPAGFAPRATGVCVVAGVPDRVVPRFGGRSG